MSEENRRMTEAQTLKVIGMAIVGILAVGFVIWSM
jgi:hypothetical protein